MNKQEWLVVSVALGILLLFAVYSLGDEAGEAKLCETYNKGHAEGYRKAYIDNMDNMRQLIKTPQETPLLNEILELKGE